MKSVRVGKLVFAPFRTIDAELVPSPPQTELRAYDEHHLVLLHRLMQFQKPPAPDVRRPAS